MLIVNIGELFPGGTPAPVANDTPVPTLSDAWVRTEGRSHRRDRHGLAARGSRRPRRRGWRRRPRARRLAHAPRLRRLPRGRVRDALRRKELPRDRTRGRRHPEHRACRARGERRRAGRGGAPAARAHALLRCDDARGEERLRAHRGRRDQDARGRATPRRAAADRDRGHLSRGAHPAAGVRRPPLRLRGPRRQRRADGSRRRGRTRRVLRRLLRGVGLHGRRVAARPRGGQGTGPRAEDPRGPDHPDGCLAGSPRRSVR